MTRYLLACLLSFCCWVGLAHAQQVLFIAPMDGDGNVTPRMARGLDTTPGMGCIDLQAANRSICAADSYPAGAVPLATIVDRLNPARKAAIEAALGISLTASDPMEVIAELLITHARTDGTRWRPLRKDPDGTYKIYLGSKKTPQWRQTAALYPYVKDDGLVADAWNFAKDKAYLAYHHTLEPAVALAATLATETFTSANGNLVCSEHTCTEFTGTAWTISSNQAVVSADLNSNEVRVESTLATVDHAVQATFVSVSGSRCSVIGRKDNTATRTFYMLATNMATPSWQTLSSVAGSRVIIATTNQSITANDVPRLEMVGSAISGHVNGVLKVGPTTNTAISTGTYGGFATHDSGGGTSCTLDGWLAYDSNQRHRRGGFLSN